MKRLFIFIAALFAGTSCAADSTISIENAWARATPPGVAVAVVYATVIASNADEIVSVKTPAAERVEMHTTSQVGGAMQMRPVATVTLPKNQRVKFATGGLHLMLMGLRAPLVAGDQIEITLNFRTSPAVTTSVRVIAPGNVPHDQ